MSQSVYVGISGSGKSYEVVRGVIVPGVAMGRRIVTNVAGLQIEAIKDYCVKHFKVDRDQLGDIVQLQNEDIEKPNLFPLEKTPAAFEAWKKKAKIEDKKRLGVCLPDDVLDLMWDEQFICQGGDIIILDECRRWYETGCKPPEGHIHFFRMHRHFLHWESGIACDLVFLTQDFKDLQRKVVGNNDKIFAMEKHDDLGFPDRYLISIYSGSRITKSSMIESLQDKYNPEIFKLYSSHSQKKAGIEVPREVKADKRGNVFNRPLIKYGIPASIIIFVLAFWQVSKFFNPETHKLKTTSSASADPSNPASAAAAPKKPPEVDDSISTAYRLVGHVTRDALTIFLVVDEHGRIRQYVNPPGYKMSRNETEMMLPNGKFATRYSGPSTKDAPRGPIL